MWFKRCDHEWKQTHTGTRMGLFFKEYKTIHIYCPKCDKSRVLEDDEQFDEWAAYQKEREIKREYEKSAPSK